MRIPPRFLVYPLGLIFWFVSGCGSSDGGDECDQANCIDPQVLSISNVLVAVNPTNLLSYRFQWQTLEDAATALDLQCVDGAETLQESFLDNEPKTTHGVLAMNLWQGLNCTYTLRSTAGEKSGETGGGFVVGAPPSWLPTFSAQLGPGAEAAPGLTYLNLTMAKAGEELPLSAVAVDAQGRLRWYHRRDTLNPGEATDVVVQEDGLLIAGPRTVPAAKVGWDGTVLWEEALLAHHHIEDLGDGTFVFPRSVQCVAGDDTTWSDEIVRWRQSDGAEIWSMRLCDVFVPKTYYSDWSHVNAISVFSDGTSLLLSVRDQNALFKVSMTTSTLEWVMTYWDDGDGQPGTDQATRFDLVANSGVTFIRSETEFIRQHAAKVLDNGNIILFDNGFEGSAEAPVPSTRTYSRGLELSYDTGTGLATMVSEVRATPDIFAAVWSDMDRLPDGHQLLTFGLQHFSGEPSVILEADASGQELWRLTLQQDWGVYRAQRAEVPYLVPLPAIP